MIFMCHKDVSCVTKLNEMQTALVINFVASTLAEAKSIFVLLFRSSIHASTSSEKKIIINSFTIIKISVVKRSHQIAQ